MGRPALNACSTFRYSSGKRQVSAGTVFCFTPTPVLWPNWIHTTAGPAPFADVRTRLWVFTIALGPVSKNLTRLWYQIGTVDVPSLVNWGMARASTSPVWDPHPGTPLTAWEAHPLPRINQMFLSLWGETTFTILTQVKFFSSFNIWVQSHWFCFSREPWWIHPHIQSLHNKS